MVTIVGEGPDRSVGEDVNDNFIAIMSKSVQIFQSCK